MGFMPGAFNGGIIYDNTGFPVAGNPSRLAYFYDDFNWLAYGGSSNLWTVNGTGSGAAVVALSQQDNEWGSIRISAQGNGSAARESLYDNITNMAPSIGTCYWEARVTFNALSDGTNPYVAYLGFGDNNGAGDMTDGIGFKYDQATNGDYWACYTENNGTGTYYVLDGQSGRPTAAVTALASGYMKLKFISRGATSADFYVNNVYKTTVSTNLPADAAKNCGLQFKIEKTTGSGTNSIILDYVRFAQVFTTAR